MRTPINLARRELAQYGVSGLDVNETYATLKTIKCVLPIAKSMGEQDVLISWAKKERTQSNIADWASDFRSIRYAIMTLANQPVPSWERRADLSLDIVAKWEKRINSTLVAEYDSKLPQLDNNIRRYNRYHYAKLIEWLLDLLKCNKDICESINLKMLSELAACNTAQWTGYDLSWFHVYGTFHLIAEAIAKDKIASEGILSTAEL